MGKSFEFKECERFLKRVLKDKGMYSKGAVIAFLITGGIGIVAPPAQAWVSTNPTTGATTDWDDIGKYSVYTSEGTKYRRDFLNSIILAPVKNNGVKSETNYEATKSVIIGTDAYAHGTDASVDYNGGSGYKPAAFTAVGNSAHVVGGQGTAIGSNTFAFDQGTAIGNDVYALGASSIAIGNDDITTKYRDKMDIDTLKQLYGDGSSNNVGTGLFKWVNYIKGDGNTASGGRKRLSSWDDFYRSYASTADSFKYSPTLSAGIGSIAIGSRSVAAKDGSTAIGTLSYALGEGSTAMGLRAYTATKATGAVAIGEESRSFAAQSLAVGNKNESSAVGAMSYGYNAKALGKGSLAFGYNTYANAVINNNLAASGGNNATNPLRASVRAQLETYTEDQLAKLGMYQTKVQNYYETLANTSSTAAQVAAAKKAMEDAKAEVAKFTVTDSDGLKLVKGGDAANTAVGNVVKGIDSYKDSKNNPLPLTIDQEDKVYLTIVDKDGNPTKVQKSKSSGDNAIAIGYYTAASGNTSIAVGSSSVVDASSGIGIGSLSYVGDKAVNSIAFGVGAQVRKENSLSLGTQAAVYGSGGVGIGSGVRLLGDDSVGIGYGTVVRSRWSVGLGRKASIGYGSMNATALGTNTNIGVNAGNSVALGNFARINDESLNSVALGFNSRVGTKALNSSAIGTNTFISDNAASAVALGDSAKVTANYSTALGREAVATNENSVALGYRSTTHYFGNPTTAEASGSDVESDTNKPGLTIAPYLPEGSSLKEKLKKLDSAAAGYVSVGGWKGTDGDALRGLRRIVNVAPGALDTDAVTVAQLRDWTDKSAHFLSLAGTNGKTSTSYKPDKAPDGTEIQSNYDNNGASGEDALALGVYAAAKGAGSVSIGRYSYGVGVNSTTLGSYAWGRGTEATVVGNHAYGYGEQSVTIGTHAVTDTDMGISIGNRSRVFSEGNNGNAGIAIGNQATAEYWNAMALGTGSQVRGFHSTALGAYARIGVPRILDANGISTNSFGSDNKIRNDKGQVIYERVVQADGLTSDADGMMTVKEYEPGTTTVKRTFKVQEVSKVDQALAFGNNATVENEKIQYTEGGIKKEKTASSNGSIAIGANARVKGSQNSVALGLNSKVVRSDTETKSTAAFTGDENNDPGNGVVSIGTIRNASDGNGVTRRIVGVAGGQNDFDAVNVKQLKAAVKYYKTNSTETNNRTVNNVADVSANYNGEGATGAASVTLGSYTKASGDYSTAIGRDVITSGKTAVGVGTNVTVSGEGSVGMGFEAKATAGNAIAIGRSVTTSGSNSFGAGSNVTVSNNYAVGLGYQATASGANAIAIGSSGQSSANVQATASDAIAIGTRAKGTASAAVAVGRFADAQGENAVALGNNTVATSQNSVAIGESANVEAGQGSIALGWNSKVTANDVKYHPTTEGKTKASPYLLNDDVDKMRDADNGVVAIGRKRTSDDGSNLARRIVGVAGGYNDYDAVNVKQLKAASWGLQVQNGSATKDVTPVGTGDLRKITLKAGDNVTLDNTNGVVTINASGGLNSITSNNTDVLGVSTTAGAVTLTPKVATTITGTGTDANKLVTSSVVNTAINNIPVTTFKADAGGSAANTEGTFTPTANKKEVNITGAGNNGNEKQTWTQGNKRFYSDNIGTHLNSDGRVLVGLNDELSVKNITTYKYGTDGKRTTTAGVSLTTDGLVGNGTDALTITNGDYAKITVNKGTSATAKGSIDVNGSKITGLAEGRIADDSTDAVTGGQLSKKLAEKANVSHLADKLDKTAERHITSGSFDANTGAITLHMVDGNGATKTDENVSITGIPTKLGYKAGDEAKKEVAVGDGLHFKSGTGTVDSTGADATTTNAETVKQGIAISTAENGVVNIGLDAATRKIINDAAKLGNTIADGRDGKVGTEAGSIASTGLTKEDGLNSKDVTTKVNALRNGEAGTVVYTDAAGKRVVKATDGKWYPADKVKPNGTKEDDAVEVTKPQARLVNPDGSTTTVTTLSNIANGTVAADSKEAITGGQLHAAETKIAEALGGGAKVENGVLTGPTYNVTKDGSTDKEKVTSVGDAVDKLDARITTVGNKPLTFSADTGDAVTRTLGSTLAVKGGDNFTAGATDKNIQVTSDNTTGLTVHLADTLTKMKGISGNGTDDLVIKNGETKITIDKGTPASGGANAIPGTVDFGGSKLTGIGAAESNTDATNKKYVDEAVGKVSKVGYKAGDEAKKEVAVGDGLHFKSGTGTVDSTGADATTTNAETVKQGIAISTAENGVVNIGLDAATRKIINDAAKLGNTIADGRDGKVGTEAGSIASTGLTKEDGLNSKDVTTKVNALRNGEAGTVVYTDDKGNRLVKANDGNWYDARVVNEKGAVKADGDIPAGVSKTAVTKPQARLVNPDGSTTIAAGTTGTTLSNIGSGAITATSTDAVTGSQLYTAKGELATALGGNATVGANGTLTGPTYSITKDDAAGGKDTATNVGDAITKLDTRINTVKENASKPLTFTGDDNQGVARKLDTTLTVKGGANVDTATTTMTAGVNIRVEKDPTANANGLTVKLADTLTGMNGITAKSARTGLTLSNGGNPTAVANATGNTEVTINESGTTFTNAQPVDPAVAGSKATTSTVTLGKDGTAEFKHATAGTTDNMVTIDSKSGTVTAGKESTKQVTINGTDGTITTGNTVVNGSSMTITEGTITTVTKAGETEYKDGDDVTTVDTAGVSISDGTADVSHTATESTFNNDTKHATYSANGATIHDGTNTATHTATGSRFEDDDKHVVTTNATGVTVTDGTNNVTVAANGITLTPSDAGTGKVSLTTAGLNNGGNRITNVGTPTDDTDAVNKVYVDARGTLRYAADTTVDDNNNKVENHTVSMLDGTLRIKGTENKVVTKATKDGITIDLAEAVNDKLAQLDAKNSDGRDGKLGSEAGAIASTGLTNEDGLNEKTTTYKVNALRNGEAGSVVYTDDAGNRLVKAVDGKYYRAEAVKRDGTLKDVADLPKGVTLAPVDNPQARVVNPDGSTKSPTVFGNVASPIEKLIAKNDAGTDLDDQSYLNKLTTASKTNASKFAAVNATDLYTTTKEILAKGINFVGNDEAVNVHRNLGAMLKVQGIENYDRPTNETANTTNILVKANTNADGLNISLAKDLHGITSITNTDGTKDTTGTKLEIGDNGFTVTHTEAGTPDKISTMTVGKDGKTTFTNSESPANTISIDSKEGTVTVGNDVAGQSGNTNKVVVNGSNATITAGTADNKKVTVDGANGILTVGGDANSANATKVTVNGTDGSITTGKTTVDGTSVSIKDGDKTSTMNADGVTIEKGDDKTKVGSTGVSISDGKNAAIHSATESKFVADGKEASYSANGVHVTDGADKSVDITSDGTTITNGTMTTTTKAGESEYVNGNKVTTVNTDGMNVTDGTNTANYTASGITLSPSASGTGTVSLTTAGLNNGGNKIANVADATSDGDVVNLKQLKAGKTTFSVNDKDSATTNHNLVLTATKDATDGHINYDVKLADKVTLGKDGNAVTVDGTNGSIIAGKDDNAVTVDGANGKITTGHTEVTGSAVTIKDAANDAKKTTVDATGTIVTDGAGKTVTTNATSVTVAEGTDKKVVTTAESVTVTDGTTTTTATAGSTIYKNGTNETTVNTTNVVVKDGTATTTTKAGETKYEANGKNLTVNTDGITVKDGNNTGSINAMNSTFTNATNGTQVGPTLIRVNGENKNNAIEGGIAIGYHADVVTSVATATKETGNFITGLVNTTWNPKANGIVSGRVATEDQLKAVDDKVNKGRVFTADTKVGDKPLEAMVGLGDTLSIKGGADMTALTDKNIGVELKDAEMKDGKVVTPATMTVKLAKNVKMADGTTSYDSYVPEYKKDDKGNVVFDKNGLPTTIKEADGVTSKLQKDKEGNPYVLTRTVVDGKGTTYHHHNLDLTGKVQVDAQGQPVSGLVTTVNAEGSKYELRHIGKDSLVSLDKAGNPIVDVTTEVTSKGVQIIPGAHFNKAPVSLSANGLDNGGNTISNVAPGEAPTDAVNVGQVNSITTVLDRRINQTGAKAAAMAAMKPLMYDPIKKSQIMAGFGTQKGAQALALGVAHYFNEDVMVNMGLSVGAGDNMMNAGVTYRFGGDDSMIPERYKGGPISSIYVMQDEISALKAENEQVKSENAQIKADNSQVRADNERMKASYEKIMEDNAQMKQDNEEMKAQIKMLMAHMGIK